MSVPRSIIWVASFPKSGNTWTRAFLGNYFTPTGKKLSINELSSITTSDVGTYWYNKAAGRPFIGETLDDSLLLRPKVQRLIASSSPGNRFVKTHSRIGRIDNIDLIMPEVTAAAIYIMRNPFDVAVSYARHANIPIDTMIDRMCDPINCGVSKEKILEAVGRWDNHIQSWTKAPGLPHHVMRYEDMVANPKTAYRNMLNFLQVPIQNKILRKALEETSFKAMQKQEEKLGFKEKPAEAKKFFVSGKAGGWVDVLTQAQVARILNEFEATIDEYFPEIGEQARTFIS
jgi:hypothetical protein